jgi:hypothetical protein
MQGLLVVIGERERSQLIAREALFNPWSVAKVCPIVKSYFLNFQAGTSEIGRKMN